MKIERECPKCGKLQTVEVSERQFNLWMAGENIQIAMPNLTSDEREILLSGICPECWRKIFPLDDED